MNTNVTKTEGERGTLVVGVTGGIGSGKSAVADV